MLERLDHVRIGAREPASAAVDYAALLAVPAAPAPAREGAWRLEAGGVGLLLVPADQDAEGLQALVFAGQGPSPGLDRTRGVAIEVAEASGREVAVAASGALGVERLDHAVVLTTDFDAALRLYRDQLGLRLALDRSFPKRGVRILFFRLAGVTIEVAGPLDPPSVLAQDHFGGLAWRGPDLLGWRERLASEGFDVSDHRPGHKPGTRVCTVKDRVHGVPTLLIGSDGADG